MIVPLVLIPVNLFILFIDHASLDHPHHIAINALILVVRPVPEHVPNDALLPGPRLGHGYVLVPLVQLPQQLLLPQTHPAQLHLDIRAGPSLQLSWFLLNRAVDLLMEREVVVVDERWVRFEGLVGVDTEATGCALAFHLIIMFTLIQW